MIFYINEGALSQSSPLEYKFEVHKVMRSFDNNCGHFNVVFEK